MFVRAAFAATLLLASIASAAACSCARPPVEIAKDKVALEKWKAELVPVVARGKVVEFSVMPGTQRMGYIVAKSKFKVESVVRGMPHVAELTIWTSVDTASCGNPGFLLAAAGTQRSIDVGITAIPDHPGEYLTNLCAHFVLMH
jgi:hypothetical protein